MVLNNFKKFGFKSLCSNRGFSLVEVMVVSAVMLLVFGGLLLSFKYTLTLVSHSRAKLTALTVANDSMEYIRSLSYNSVGTISGIPAGLIPQVSTTSLNGIVFTKKVLINYVDDPKDGYEAADSNGIKEDYKQAKITISWSERGVPTSIFLVTNIIPPSIETNVGGGTLRVNVFDALVAPLPGAVVHLVNNTLLPKIDITRSTDSTGIALFGGAPAGPDYEISVTAPGYSTDKTYMSTTTLPNPTTQPVAVVEAGISTMNFFIDKLSNLDVKVLASKTMSQTDEMFNDASGVATSSYNVNVTSGKLALAGSVGSYATSGIAYLTEITPTPLASWDLVTVTPLLSANTNVMVRFYTGTSTYTLIPDSDLQGNSAGFNTPVINLSKLNASNYSSLTVGIELLSTSVNETPLVDEIKVAYVASKVPLTGASLTMTGDKAIGTLTDGSTVYKNNFTNTTAAVGSVSLPNIEWDKYTASVSGYDIKEACGANPLKLSPGASTTLEILTTVNTPNSLRVVVQTTMELPLPGATVTLKQGAFTSTKTTSACGQVFFSSLVAASDYTLDITPVGYSIKNITGVNISGDIVDVESF